MNDADENFNENTNADQKNDSECSSSVEAVPNYVKFDTEYIRILLEKVDLEDISNADVSGF